MKKKFLAILLACSLAAGLAVSPVGTEDVWAGYVTEGTYNGFSYDYYYDDDDYEDYIEITGYTGTDTTVEIPGDINGIAVTGIVSDAFLNCSNLVKVTIPSSVTSIPIVYRFDSPSIDTSNPFTGCSQLKEILVDEKNPKFKSIDGVLCSKSGELISYPEGRGTEARIPEGVTKIGRDAFLNCSSLVSVTIPSSVTSISDNPFIGCSQLTKILVEGNDSSYESIDGILCTAFGELISYPEGKGTPVSIPERVKEIGSYAFSDYSKLTSITIPSSVTGINEDAFWNCSGLTSVTISKDVEHMNISDRAFGNCSSLTSITIPSGVTGIGENPFIGCSQLKEILVEEKNSSYESRDGILCSKAGKLISYPQGKGATQVSIPEGVTSIGSYAFSGYSKMTGLTIPKSVTNIGMYAFYDCSGLTSLTIPEGVTSISKYAFRDCTSLTSVIIPLSVKTMAYGVFIQGINLSNSLKDIYYAGSKEQFNEIIESIDRFWDSKNIHYNSTGPADTGSSGSTTPTKPTTPTDPTTPGTETPGKTDQTITAKNITKTYGAKAFNLNAKSSIGAALTYTVSDKKVATVDKKGKVTIKGCGITNITITAKGTDKYNQAKKTIKLTVKPKKVTISSVKSTKKKTAAVKWKQDKKASGYIIQCATDSKFKKNKVQVTVSKNKTVSTTVKKLKAGKKYYVRVCAYAKSGKTKVQGDWSKVKTVKVKK